MRPLAIDLFAGMFGWGRAFADEGYRVIGFDIEHLPHHGAVPDHCELVLQDVLTLHGSQFRNAAVIVASPPCQEFSYRGMPWKRARAIVPDPIPDWWKKTEAQMNDSELHEWAEWRDKHPIPPPSTALFDACFRIQREASEAGRYIPLVVENVRAAQRWVGPARANFGSFFFWGDIANVGGRVYRPDAAFGSDSVAAQARAQAAKVPGFWFDGSGGSFQTASVEARKFNPDGTDHPTGLWFRIADSSQGDRGVKVASKKGRRTDPGNGARFTSRDCGVEAGLKRPGVTLSEGFNNWPKDEAGAYVMPDGTKIGGDWFSDPNSTCRKHGSRSTARKAASAMIAKIPERLARHVARMYKP